MNPQLIASIGDLRTLLDAHRAEGRVVGFVPTMGFLHEGYGSLMDRAVEQCDVTVTSVFVNPLQFAAGEDLDDYPRDLDRDIELAGERGVDVVFHPDVDEMYPDPVLTTVSVSQVSEPLEGRTRPTHFAGVATVVAKLISIIGPCRAYFGEKDWQQVAVIQRMVSDLSMPVDVVPCPTVREADMVAMSSRNVYLTDEERQEAPLLHQALVLGREMVASGERDPRAVERAMADHIATARLGELDYAAAVDAATLRGIDPLVGEVRLLVACRFGRARLIDNMGVLAD